MPLRYMGQPERGRNLGHKTYVEVDEREEEKEVEVPLMLNCWDWVRMLTPVPLGWTKLIWKPLPVGQPTAGPSTVVELSAVRTPFFKMMLMGGVDCYRERTVGKRNSGQAKVRQERTWLTRAIEKLEGSVETKVQATV